MREECVAEICHRSSGTPETEWHKVSLADANSLSLGAW